MVIWSSFRHGRAVDFGHALDAVPAIWLVPWTIRNSRVAAEGKQRHPRIIVLHRAVLVLFAALAVIDGHGRHPREGFQGVTSLVVSVFLPRFDRLPSLAQDHEITVFSIGKPHAKLGRFQKKIY